jgi:SAM-dependent methyltransferase
MRQQVGIIARQMSKETPANEYSATWFEVFLPPSETVAPQREIEFLRRWLPLPTYARVLDLCCGIGRHAQALSDSGYVVMGLDRSPQALCTAVGHGRGTRYVQGDMRAILFADGSFDAVVCLWQSFGYFDEATNRQVLRAMRKVLAPNGRLILDVYHRGFFAANGGCRRITKNSHEVVERKQMIDGRLRVELIYEGTAAADTFDWQLFEPEELCEVARQAHFSPLAVCADFDAAKAASKEYPRMQLVFEAKSR